jgi:hypothetical protein
MKRLRVPTRAVVATFTLVALLAIAACGDDSDTTSTAGSGDGHGDAEVVVQVVVAGGFVTPESALSTVPEVTVLSDGTILSPGFVPAVYPGPALTPIQAATVDPAEVEALVERARALGLLDGPLDFGQPGISDAPTTTVTITVNGTTHRHDAYALSFGEDVGAAGPGAVEQAIDDGAGLSDEQKANREALSEFVAAAHEVGVGDALWTPAAYAVTVVGPAVEDPSGLAQEPVPWPLDTVPSTEGDFPCTVIDGDDASTLATALTSANTETPWVIDGEELSVAFRPLVPGDPGCP